MALPAPRTEAVNLSPAEFERELRRLCRHFFPDAALILRNRRIQSISCRIHVTAQIFVDVYYNVRSGRLDFSTIQAGQRVFGYDNAGGWHYPSVSATGPP